jgi:hypothetical protein
MSRDEFASSFYIDTLFECHLPTTSPSRRRGHSGIPLSLHADRILRGRGRGGAPLRPLRAVGPTEVRSDAKLFRYYLNARDISSEVEWTISKKPIGHPGPLRHELGLEGAKKTIEMHKLMLISLVCSLIEDYNRETSVHLQTSILTGYLTEECDGFPW